MVVILIVLFSLSVTAASTASAAPLEVTLGETESSG